MVDTPRGAGANTPNDIRTCLINAVIGEVKLPSNFRRNNCNKRRPHPRTGLVSLVSVYARNRTQMAEIIETIESVEIR